MRTLVYGFYVENMQDAFSIVVIMKLGYLSILLLVFVMIWYICHQWCLKLELKMFIFAASVYFSWRTLGTGDLGGILHGHRCGCWTLYTSTCQSVLPWYANALANCFVECTFRTVGPFHFKMVNLVIQRLFPICFFSVLLMCIR